MNKKWSNSLEKILLIILILIITRACSSGDQSQTPIDTPSLINDETTSIAGIDPPLIIDGVKIQILSASVVEEWLIEYLDHNFEIEFIKEILPDIDWVDQNSVLVCGEGEYKAVTQGVSENDNGDLQAVLLCYEVPPDIDYKNCVFQILESEISLATFF